MPWIRKQLRGVRVWARCNTQGELLTTPQGRVDICYQPQGPLYQAAARNLTPLPDSSLVPDEEVQPTPILPTHISASKNALVAPSPVPTAALLLKEPYQVYTDGACTGNPGPMGIGVVVLTPTGERQEWSEYLGMGTNNIAELTAIARGLSLVPSSEPATVYTDSSYALGVLTQGWKARANQTLIAEMRTQIQKHPNLQWVKVAGHAGIVENERCDLLARNAITQALKKERIR